MKRTNANSVLQEIEKTENFFGITVPSETDQLSLEESEADNAFWSQNFITIKGTTVAKKDHAYSGKVKDFADFLQDAINNGHHNNVDTFENFISICTEAYFELNK